MPNAAESEQNDNETLSDISQLTYLLNQKSQITLADPDRSIAMMNKYPLVKALFTKFNMTLPSTATVECLFNFSVGGQIEMPKRNQLLSDSNSEKLLL